MMGSLVGFMKNKSKLGKWWWVGG